LVENTDESSFEFNVDAKAKVTDVIAIFKNLVNYELLNMEEENHLYIAACRFISRHAQELREVWQKHGDSYITVDELKEGMTNADVTLHRDVIDYMLLTIYSKRDENSNRYPYKELFVNFEKSPNNSLIKDDDDSKEPTDPNLDEDHHQRPHAREERDDSEFIQDDDGNESGEVEYDDEQNAERHLSDDVHLDKYSEDFTSEHMNESKNYKEPPNEHGHDAKPTFKRKKASKKAAEA
jgi:hypothetical protein